LSSHFQNDRFERTIPSITSLDANRRSLQRPSADDPL
jgi:hypothetical protein